MNKKYAQLPEDMREAMATNAGIVLSEFDPENPGEDAAIREKLLCATSGGVNVTCVATLSDWGEDVDNCPKNTKEMAEIEGWECGMSGTALTVSSAVLSSMAGSADETAGATDTDLKVIKPRMTISKDDFKELWYVCPYGTQGGFVAAKLFNAYSTGGISFQSADKAKGQWSFAYTGYSSIEKPDEVPMTFYLKKSAAEATQTVAVE